MLKILHKGIQANLDLDTSGFSGVIEDDQQSDYIQGLAGGRIVALDSDGKAQLADGLPGETLEPIGFLINDAAGYYFENVPALASLKVAVTFGNCVIITDQIETGDTFAPGNLVYCGTTGVGDGVGLVSKVQAAGATLLGIAGSAAASASPELLIYVK
jgi:hypothetical protein